MRGDSDLDGDVDPADVSVLVGNFATAGGWPDGDFDGGGSVGPEDVSLLVDITSVTMAADSVDQAEA